MSHVKFKEAYDSEMLYIIVQTKPILLKILKL